MKGIKAPKKLRTTATKLKTKASANSPEIFIFAGIVAVIGGTITACKATTTACEILDEAKENLESVHKLADDAELCEKHNYTEKERKKDIALIYAQTGMKLAGCYAPAFIMGGLGVYGILTSHKIMKKRNAALTASFAATSKAFKEYRGRVVERFGAEVDNELRYNIKAKKIEETIIDENGKAKKVKKTVGVVDPEAATDWTQFVIDSSVSWWENDQEYNRMILKNEQQYATDVLRSRKHLYLNDVLERLDLPKTPQGQLGGWVWDSKNDEVMGDGFVDFNINMTYRENPDYENGLEPIITLDFNCDGNIHNLMYDKEHAKLFA